MPGPPAHLFARFIDVATAPALDPVEIEAVAKWLSPPLADLFFEQPVADQRHGYAAALVVRDAGTGDHDVIVAALVHDIGKRHSRLGVIGRSLASLMIKLHLPIPVRARMYRDHGALGARELAYLAAPSLAIDFALHHHGARPESITPETWSILKSADEPPKPSEMVRTRIMSRIR
ncbi:MAG TPA: hypothetical protein VJ948_07340 [Acidimicrobiia bacterium]|nr:hypothetical protein [Acidimicrobiia bacterium]